MAANSTEADVPERPKEQVPVCSTREMLWKSLPDALRKLIRAGWRNPVMFIVGSARLEHLLAIFAELVRLADRVLAVADRGVREPRRKPWRKAAARHRPSSPQDQADTMARRLAGWDRG